MVDTLVSTAWLEQHLSDPDVHVIDGTYMPPGFTRDALAEYRQGHIPGAVFFDVDKVADTSTTLPHMLPTPEDFAAHVGRMGIGDDDHVVVYDGHGLMTAPRVWWMFRVFGHDRVSVLDGGLPKWLLEERPVNSAAVQPEPRNFTPRFRPELVRDLDQVRTTNEQVLDARAADRFTGAVDEPWPGRRRGHIPGSWNLPIGQLLNPIDKTVLPPDQLDARFQTAGIDLNRPVITSCGSGVTACTLAFGLHLIGKRDVAVYDGSWAEWGLRDDLPAEVGPSHG